MTARILIVDDAPANTRLMHAMLQSEYYQVEAATNAAEALRIALDWQPDLVLLDVMMPGMDGYDCCARLKADPGTQHIPVIMVTVLDAPDARVRGLEVGADDFLTRPVEHDTLLARLRSLVRLKRLLDEWRARGETGRALGLPTPTPEPSVRGAVALVIEDDAAGARAIAEALALEGLSVDHALDGYAAMARSASSPVDLIVLSLSLSGEDPLALASRLRAADATHNVPQLLVVAPAQHRRLLRGFDLGVNDWLVRPIDRNELRARARNQVRRKLYQDRLRAEFGHALQLAVIDPLTGLYNRRYLGQHLRSLTEGPAARDIATLLIDIDRFKRINDIYGHAAGDLALQAVADALRAQTRAFDTLARYGGEEFVLVMPGVDVDEAMAAADRLRVAIAALSYEPAPGMPEPLTVSVGVAHAPAGRHTADGVLLAADAALYTAKRAGRNRVEVAPTYTAAATAVSGGSAVPVGATLSIAPG
jgi:two-component system cell cycle response regulator